MNGWIAGVNLLIAATLAAIGGVMLWQGRLAWREWPPGFLIACGGWVMTLFLVFGQIALFRWGTVEGIFAANGAGTLGLRVLCLCFSVALLRRLLTGTLATAADRARVDGGTG